MQTENGLGKLSNKSALRKTLELGIGLTAISVLLVGCLGGSGGTTAAGASTVVGKFIDAAVDGLTYSCGTTTGVTSNGGQFTCASGSNVTFSLGKITLGTAPVAGIITPMNLAGAGSNSASSAVQAISQLLLSLDPTAAAAATAGSAVSAINISSAVLAAANNLPALVTVGSATTPADVGGWLSSIASATAQTFTLVPAATATAHLNKSMNGLFQGAYSGNFSGAISGTWSVTIDANGNVTGSGADSTGGPFAVSGVISTTLGVGNGFNFSGTGGAYTWTGTLNPATGNFSGTWDGVTSNTYTGNKAAAAGTGGAIACNTAHYTAGAVHAPTAAELAGYAKTYSGNTGTFNVGSFTPTGSSAVFVLGNTGSLSYNGTAQTVASICKDNTNPMIYVEFGTQAAVDFFADGSFTGNLDAPAFIGVQSVGFGAGTGGTPPPTTATGGLCPTGSGWDPVLRVCFGAAGPIAGTGVCPTGLVAGPNSTIAANINGWVCNAPTGGTTAPTPGLFLTPISGAVGTRVAISGLTTAQYAAYQPNQIKFGTTPGTGYQVAFVGTTGASVSALVPVGLTPGVYTVTYVDAAGLQPVLTAGTFTVQ